MQQATDVQLPDKDAQLLAEYAQAHGITVDEAATRLAQTELVRRFGAPRVAGARVVPLRPR